MEGKRESKTEKGEILVRGREKEEEKREREKKRGED